VKGGKLPRCGWRAPGWQLKTHSPRTSERGGEVCQSIGCSFSAPLARSKRVRSSSRENDVDAVLIGAPVADACSEVYAGYERWNGKRRILRRRQGLSFLVPPPIEGLAIEHQKTGARVGGNSSR
jgi:hypothetical protein